jgi:hypothetical protein
MKASRRENWKTGYRCVESIEERDDPLWPRHCYRHQFLNCIAV